MAESEKIVDLTVAREHLPGDEAFLKRVAALTVEELPKQLGVARDALAADDLDGCRKGVHAFQTAIRSFGSVAAGRASDAVMGAAAAGDRAATRAAFEDLEAAVAVFLAALRDLDRYLEADSS